MKKLDWDNASAKSKQHKLNQSAQTTKAQTIAKMVDSCIKTMKRKGEHNHLSESELITKATEWALKAYEKNQFYLEVRRAGK